MAELMASLEGLLPFLMHFGPAVVLLLVFMAIYKAVTPHDESALIKQNNIGAAIAYGGAIIGFALPISSALKNSTGLIDFLVWAVVSGIVQLAVFLVFRRFYPKISERIEAGEVAAPAKLATISVMVGLMNAAAMTY